MDLQNKKINKKMAALNDSRPVRFNLYFQNILPPNREYTF